VLAALFAAAFVTVGGLGAGRLARWWNAPGAVPDHTAPYVASFDPKFAARTELAQRVVPRRSGFTAVDLVLSAEEPNLPGAVRLTVRDETLGQDVRQARVPAAALPTGSVWQYRPNQPRERWTTFGFEPIPGSAGRSFLVTISYADGRDTPGARLSTLAHLPRSYGLGEFLLNGRELERGGTMLFRLAAAGTNGQAVQTARENLARSLPLGSGTLTLPALLLGCCGALYLALLAAITRQHSLGR
jgi:hypothetical protein